MPPDPRPDHAPRRRVLLLDDHVYSSVVMLHALRLRGHRCESVATMQDALASVRSYKTDLVAYEWSLHHGVLTDVAHRVRAIASTVDLHLTIIAVSVVDEPVGFSAREQVDAYLTKPVDMHALDRILAM